MKIITPYKQYINMKKAMMLTVRFLLGAVMIAVSAACLILVLCYYGEPKAVLPAAGCGVCFILAQVLLINE